ncbi:hypothetical protein [Breoghania sp.]|uniref:hypothetical protein n=1 Tax=Breoghania sp. TaxID=2065378 RepID=UPI00263243D3|nr:hypothetical protein [Breoghania sp.]MDJ0931990.1 hypothetical protein [Breoghania sp.]
MRLYPFANVCERRVLFTPQFFDAEERALLADHIRDDMIFVDVGANVGIYSLFVAGLVGPEARIIAVELQPLALRPADAQYRLQSRVLHRCGAGGDQ